MHDAGKDVQGCYVQPEIDLCVLNSVDCKTVTVKNALRIEDVMMMDWAVDTMDLWSQMMRTSSAVWVETNARSTNVATRDASKAASCRSSACFVESTKKALKLKNRTIGSKMVHINAPFYY